MQKTRPFRNFFAQAKVELSRETELNVLLTLQIRTAPKRDVYTVVLNCYEQ